MGTRTTEKGTMAREFVKANPEKNYGDYLDWCFINEYETVKDGTFYQLRLKAQGKESTSKSRSNGTLYQVISYFDTENQDIFSFVETLNNVLNLRLSVVRLANNICEVRREHK